MKKLHLLTFAIGLTTPLFGQPQNFYTGSNITGQLVLMRTVNAMQQAQIAQGSHQNAHAFQPHAAGAEYGPELKNPGAEAMGLLTAGRRHSMRPPLSQSIVMRALHAHAQAAVVPQKLTVGSGGGSGFNGLSHFDERNANNGNQFSVEPPSQGLAVSNGFIVHGVNNAFQVYSTSGTPLLPVALSTNQLFGVSPAINRTTGVFGVYPTDIRVFYDQTMDRWLVMQRSQDNDAFNNPLNSSHFFIAVSQTNDPTGTYNIYVMDTTNSGNLGCPCIADYPQVGADEFGIYITANEYNPGFFFVDATILAISKVSLSNGASAPTMVRFQIPNRSGFEFAIQPAATPVGASYFLANGGLQYFVSSQASFSFDSNLALWALTNTSSLGISSPNLTLVQTIVPSLSYAAPDIATQRPGPTPLGTSLGRPLEVLDGGDTRIQSTTYAAGRLWVTLETQVTDDFGHFVTGIAYIVYSPTFRSGVLSAPVLRQGSLFVSNNHLLRPALGVNALGNGAIICTLVGPNYFPSAAFVPINLSTTGPNLQIAAAGSAPEDGFSGYSGQGIARWGDYSAAVTDVDGSIWMATEFIPDTPRTQLANWGSFITRVVPQ